jgi:hypothetical protein
MLQAQHTGAARQEVAGVVKRVESCGGEVNNRWGHQCTDGLVGAADSDMQHEANTLGRIF